ncbi:MAG: IS30 family transposase, partial [Faecalibacterium prausnitzii]
GCDFRVISDEDLDRVIALLNNRPRKCLDWKTPAEIFFTGVALD